MIEEYVPVDRRHDNLYERFIEQRVQKFNNLDQSSVSDFIPIPIELFRTVPTAHPRKLISNTSSDSGVNSPQTLSPAIPVTPTNLHYPQPSLLRMDPYQIQRADH